MTAQNFLCGFLHGGECASGKLIGVYHNIYAVLCQFLFGDCVKGGWNYHKGSFAVLRSEFVAKFQNFGRVFFAAVNHYSVRPRFYKGSCPGQSVLHSSFKDKAFYSGNYHKVVGKLNLFACGNFFAKMLD